MVRVVFHPTTGALTRAYMVNDMAPVARMAPAVSKWARRARLLSLSTNRNAAMSTTTQIGGFTKNTHRQPGPPESRAPRKTQTAGGSPAIAPQGRRARGPSVPRLQGVARHE